MSLLLKALKNADRGSALTLEPMPGRASDAAPPSAKAAADLMFEKHAASEKQRLLILLGTLGAVVVGMAVYFYIAIFMPWVFLPKPLSGAAQPVVAAPAPSSLRSNQIGTLPPLTQTLPTPPVTKAPEPPLAQAPIVQMPPAQPNRPPRKSESIALSSVPDSGVTLGSSTTTSSGGIVTAYQLLQDGRLEDARRAYEKLRALEPRNPDVSLGLALIAQRQGRNDEAVQHYLKALEIEPKNAFAQASLTGMIARADPQAAETKFKSLIAQQPAAYLSFGLGNVYAAHGRWNEAQSAYFDAQRQAPDSPDYAFNLAVSLEQINQPRAALDYYQRAIKLMQSQGASFDVAQVRSRIQQLSNVK